MDGRGFALGNPRISIGLLTVRACALEVPSRGTTISFASSWGSLMISMAFCRPPEDDTAVGQTCFQCANGWLANSGSRILTRSAEFSKALARIGKTKVRSQLWLTDRLDEPAPILLLGGNNPRIRSVVGRLVGVEQSVYGDKAWFRSALRTVEKFATVALARSSASHLERNKRVPHREGASGVKAPIADH